MTPVPTDHAPLLAVDLLFFASNLLKLLAGGRLEFGTPKTHQQRTVPLPATLAESLARHCEGKQGDDKLYGVVT